MFDPADFRRLASKILRRAKAGEAECRTAISRLYYSVFLQARVYLDPYFHFSKLGAVHDEIQLLFKNSSHPVAMQLANKISALRAQRNAADYDLAHPAIGTVGTARLAEEIASRVSKEMADLFSGNEVGSVIATMRSWAKMSSKPRPKS